MKTICFTLLLLLLSVCCTDAMPHGISFNTAPESCCFNLSKKAFPPKAVSSIKKTYSYCANAAFIVTTKRGSKHCYDQNSRWAQKIYNQHHGQESSTQ